MTYLLKRSLTAFFFVEELFNTPLHFAITFHIHHTCYNNLKCIYTILNIQQLSKQGDLFTTSKNWSSISSTYISHTFLWQRYIIILKNNQVIELEKFSCEMDMGNAIDNRNLYYFTNESDKKMKYFQLS